MKVLYGRAVRLIILVLILSASTLVQAHNQLKKLFLHQAPRGVNIERLKLAFYFEQSPKISSAAPEKIRQGDLVLEKRNFIFNGVDTIAQEAQTAINEINARHDQGCGITVAMVNKSLMLTLQYDPNRIDISYENFESIGLQKGVVFRMIDKEVLVKIRNNESPMLRTASLQRKSVVIDCGHGGSDTGTIGIGGIKEKDICFNVGMEVAQLLKQHAIDVHLSRSKDIAVSLDKRTSYANGVGADLFVSIHANSAPSEQACGVETFWLRPSLCNSVATTLSPKNQTVFDEQRRLLAARSEKLAHEVHESLLRTVASYSITDRKVKEQVSQLLLGSNIPTILVEIGFLSHKKEAELLAQLTYQRTIARGIFLGILSYLS